MKKIMLIILAVLIGGLTFIAFMILCLAVVGYFLMGYANIQPASTTIVSTTIMLTTTIPAISTTYSTTSLPVFSSIIASSTSSVYTSSVEWTSSTTISDSELAKKGYNVQCVGKDFGTPCSINTKKVRQMLDGSFTTENRVYQGYCKDNYCYRITLPVGSSISSTTVKPTTIDVESQ